MADGVGPGAAFIQVVGGLSQNLYPNMESFQKTCLLIYFSQPASEGEVLCVSDPPETTSTRDASFHSIAMTIANAPSTCGYLLGG